MTRKAVPYLFAAVLWPDNDTIFDWYEVNMHAKRKLEAENLILSRIAPIPGSLY